jgi:hypothetical protein
MRFWNRLLPEDCCSEQVVAVVLVIYVGFARRRNYVRNNYAEDGKEGKNDDKRELCVSRPSKSLFSRI